MSLEFKSVIKKQGMDTHIYETSLALEPGEFNILLGTTLSGKTTLMRLMAGLEKPTGGEIWFDGSNVTGLPVQKRSVAMVYQQFINYPSFTVYENIASPLKVAGFSKPEIQKKVDKIAELLKLSPMLDRLPAELSGGQQQRTALARALAKDASLVLLDEPLANLDYKLREELRDELPRLFADSGATVVYATSEPLEALMLGGNTVTLNCGRVVQYGKTGDVYRHPVSVESARVFSDPPINIATVEKVGSRVSISADVGWNVPDKLVERQDGTYQVGIRPHHLSPNGGGVRVNGEVQVAEISGSESIVRLTVQGHHWVSQARGIHSYEVGQKSDFFIDTERCLYFDPAGKLVSDAAPE